ncbi:hypothetical protein Hanom_Chr04g00360731 [Helianthus anomalus]
MFYTFISCIYTFISFIYTLFHVFIHSFHVFMPLLHVFLNKYFSPCLIWLLTAINRSKLKTDKLTKPINR